MSNTPTPEAPTPAAMRALLDALGDVDRKVLGGLTTLFIAEPTRVRDEEWISEQFLGLAVLAHGAEAGATPDGATSEDVEAMRRYARERMSDLVGGALQLFVRTAVDLQSRGAPFSFADARAVVLGYIGEDCALDLDDRIADA